MLGTCGAWGIMEQAKSGFVTKRLILKETKTKAVIFECRISYNIQNDLEMQYTKFLGILGIDACPSWINICHVHHYVKIPSN